MKTTPATLAAFAAVNLFAVLLACELAGRVNYFVHHDLSFWTPATKLWYRFYPDLQQASAEPPQGPLRVLLLGGSTLSHGFCNVDDRLRDGLSAMTGHPVEVVNLAVPAQSMLDSWYKYWYLRDVPFDLVIPYHGINELRANCVPEDVWRDDYGHYAWYDEVNFFFRHQGWARGGFIFPFYLQHQAVAWSRRGPGSARKVPYNSVNVRPDWIAYGATIRSAAPFRQQFERALDLAERKGDPVLLMTFAHSLPDGYSSERFARGELGYDRSKPGEPAEVWGRPEDLRKGLSVHNAVIAELAAARHLPLVDQAALMDGDPKLFIDVCHFSPAGAERFAGHILAALARRPRWRSQVARPNRREGA